MTCRRAARDVYLEADGKPDAAHLASCADCRQALEVVRRIREALPSVGAEARSAGGWQERVLAEIDRTARRPARRMPRRFWWATAGPVAAAVALFFWWWYSAQQARVRVADLRLDLEVARKGDVRGSASIGDVVRVRAAGGDGHAVLWVYRDRRELVVSCPGDPRCKSERARLSADLPIARPGLYQFLFAASAGELPAPPASIDEALAAVAVVGARYRMDELEVF